MANVKKWLKVNNDRISVLSLSYPDKGSIGVIVNAPDNEIILDYLYRDSEKIHDRIVLESKRSNLNNGVVWYFICPETGSRCRVLYLYRGHYVSRKAIPNGRYKNQCSGKRWREMMTLFNSIQLIEEKTKYLKRHYRGKPTPRFLKIENKARWGLRYLQSDLKFK